MTRDEVIDVMARAIEKSSTTNYGVVSFPNADWHGEAIAVLAALEAIGMVIIPIDYIGKG